jgi:hypothetical protein
MPSFSDSFWSAGYAPGFNVIFDKLSQGCNENDEVLALVAARADAEEAYGNRLMEIPGTYNSKKNGFGRDDGASLRKAYEGIIEEMGSEGKHHVQVADNIRRMVLVPFGKWAGDHRQRVDYSGDILKGKLKSYEKELSEVQKCQKRYFNKCRVLEDYKESGVTEPVPVEAPDETPASAPTSGQNGAVEESQHEEESISLGGEQFSGEEAEALFKAMLEEIPQKDIKVPILGTYDHISTGDQIVAWIQTNVSKVPSLATAERFGQSLISDGYLRLVGQVGSKFANSSVMNYQWRKKAYIVAKKPIGDQQRDLIAPIVGEYLSETFHNYISNPHPDESPEDRLKREVTELDGKYKQSVDRLDDIRCNLEESAIDHLKFMERCESDRLKAIKAVFLDFLAALSNVVPSIQSSVDNLLLYQETVHPSNDLRYILESYRTGPFSPKVTVYDNYYNSSEDQTFGVDLELRCRGDRRRVPFIVSSILAHMDSQYPDLDNDEVRLRSWVVSVPLKSTHKLRKEINTGKSFQKQLLQSYEAPIVASVLKLYLVELPESLVPSSLYDIVKTIYSQHGNDEDPRQRISALQNTLAQLRISNIATLDAITTHLTRLISITNADGEYVSQLSQELSYCVLRPRVQSALTIGDRHAYLLVRDLLTHREQIFKELKRNNSNSSSRKGSSELPVRGQSLKNRLDSLSNKIQATTLSDTTTAIESELENGQSTTQPRGAGRQNESLTSPPPLEDMSPYDERSPETEPMVKTEQEPRTADSGGEAAHPIVID